jgi:small subunit ribosomal protein S2
MQQVQLNELLEAGVHFGHQTRRWNPKMRGFIFGERNGIHIIDLRKTLDRLNRAQQAVRDVVLKGERVLFVCTKRQLRSVVEQEALSVRLLLRDGAVAGRHAHELPDHPEADPPA